MPWTTQTLPHSRITGKNSTDSVTRVPKSSAVLADPIPSGTNLLTEAKALLEAEALTYSADIILSHGGAEAFFTAAFANSQVTGYWNDALAWAYLYFWYNSSYSQEGDRFYLARDNALSMLRRLMPGAMDVTNGVLGMPTGDSRVVIRGRVSAHDAWG